MGLYKNTGAPFERQDGSTWEREEVHTPTELELRRNAHKLREVECFAPAEVPQAPEQPAAEETPVAASVKGVPVWHMSITPMRYLSMAPEGEHAELARQCIEASGAEFYRHKKKEPKS